MQTSNAGERDHHSVSAAVVLRREAVLLCHRHPNRQWFPDVWDLPGGHIEPGESSAVAVVRELREELGIEATVEGRSPFRSLQLSPTLSIDLWVVTRFRGEPANLAPEEHDLIEWVLLPELSQRALAHGLLHDVIVEAARDLNGTG